MAAPKKPAKKAPKKPAKKPKRPVKRKKNKKGTARARRRAAWWAKRQGDLGDDVIKRLRAISESIPRAIREQILPELAAELLRRAQDLVPKDTGNLAASGYAEPDPEGNGMIVGFASKYALVQHEKLSAKHPKGGSAKYLERPLFELERDLESRIVDFCNREIGG